MAAAGKDSHDKILRDHLLYLLSGGGAHAKFDDAIEAMPEMLRGLKPEGMPHTAWMLLEHLRLAQWDILEFSRNPKHKSPPWPKGYWPKTDAPPDAKAWDKSVQKFREDAKAMQSLIADPETDLYAPIPWADDKQTILREALLVADHNAYHIGQFIDLRRLLGTWKES